MTSTAFSINTRAYRATGPLVGCSTTRELAHALRGYGEGADARILADDILDGRVRLKHTADKLDQQISERRCLRHREAIAALIRYSEHSQLLHCWDAKDRADWMISGLQGGALTLVTDVEALADLINHNHNHQ